MYPDVPFSNTASNTLSPVFPVVISVTAVLSSAPTSFHPRNVYPVFSSVGSVTACSIVYDVGCGVPVTYEPPFKFEYVIAYGVGV